MQSQNDKNKYEVVAQFIQILANLAVVFGIIFAIVQLVQTNHIESVRLAVEATDPTRTREFLESYGKLLDAYDRDSEMLNTDSLQDDLSFVMTVYDNIAILYLHNLADKEIIKARVYDAMSRLAPILDAKKWPMGSRANFDAALARMSARHLNTENKNTQNERHTQ
jgi:hypothetical protein